MIETMNPDRPISVLYLDDNPLDRDLVRDALEREHSGFRMTELSDARELARHLRKGSFDVVLSDFHLGGNDGFDVLAEVRAS